ncbi:epithelial splicing regulatory protein 1-like isoform X4 [Argonauta hians]
MASSHILVLFCATTGKNNEELGVDEEQIVLLVYLLFDVTNNKVVALQQHFVKPQPNEISETLLTEDCKTETGLEEEVIKNSQPLEHVLDEMDRFLSAKGVHPDHGGKSFTICTDGQAHLRQCLHPECSKKNINLPKYMFKFYDLRKEFRKFYRTEGTGIKTMLEHLGLQGDQSVEYGVHQCQEMASILQRMLTSGHSFVTAEIIKDHLEPGICKNERVDDNTVVRARGLPWQSSDQDIARFFKGLNIMKGGVALCLSQQGRRNGEALIWFESEEHRDLAMKRHKHHIGQRYIEVYKSSGKDFLNVAGGNNLEAQAFLSRGGQVIIRMRGLPFTATVQQVLEFFTREPNACTVLDGEEGILFVYYPDGRSTGDAFVLFSSEDEASKALKKHRDIMGTRYIELFKSTMAEVQQVLNRSMDPRNPEQTETALPPLIANHPTSGALVPHNMMTTSRKRDCIRLRNLPTGAHVTDILTYLGEYSQFIAYQGVHMVYGANGELSGEAFIQMNSEDSAYLTGLYKHKKSMIYSNKKRVIDAIQCSADDMNLVLANGVPTIYPSHPALMPRPMFAPPPPPHTSLIPTANALTGTVPYSHITQTVPSFHHPPLAPLPPRPSYYPPVFYWYPSPPVSPQTYYAQNGPSVVVMRGLPYNSSVQDIMNFFQGFPEQSSTRNSQVSPESIQIQQSTDGRPNGDALVTFSSRCEAERAITERNRNSIGNRFVELFMA